MNYVDLILLVLIVFAGVAGYRTGLIAAALGLLGVVIGALVALQVAPLIADRLTEQAARVGLSAVLVLVGVFVGQGLGNWVGSAISRQLSWRPIQALDHALGLVGRVAMTLALAWLVALPMAALPVPAISAQVRTSAILTGINAAVPEQAAAVSAQLRALLAGTGLPPILAPLAPAPNIPVAEPDSGLAVDPVVRSAHASVLKIRADAPKCRALLQGTGFAVAPGIVVTNAHVVAGSSSVVVETASGDLAATVVAFNANVDVAVLRVPGLGARPLTMSDGAVASGQDAIALGYPLDGPYTASPIRVRGEMVLRGPNIYSKETISREVYALRGSVRPGNSGGPLISPRGEVIGVIFGAATDDPDVGFALTVAQAKPTIAVGLVSSQPVATGACVPH